MNPCGAGNLGSNRAWLHGRGNNPLLLRSRPASAALHRRDHFNLRLSHSASEGYAEKYRAVVDEGYLKDEPVGQRWGKVEPALWGRRRSHTPTAPRCLRTARYGRSGREPRRTSRVLGWHRGKRLHKRK